MAAQPQPSETSEHATVMVVNHAPWTPFEECDPALARGPRPARLAAEKVYRNSRYQVAVYPPKPAHLGGEGYAPRVVHLCFKHRANIAITDFRDFQRIKNELVHPEAYAFQIYPPEAHLVDSANQYHLWVLVPDCYPELPEDDAWPCLPYGFFDGRMVTDNVLGNGRQRTFEEPPAEEDRQQVAQRMAELSEWQSEVSDD